MVIIIADTTSTLPVATAEQLGIPYLPQIIVFGDKSYRDDTELTAKTFIEKLRAAPELPKTAAPPPALYTPIFEKLAADGDTGIVLCPPKGVSGTFRSAEVAAQDFPQVDIRVIDTHIVAASLGTLVLKAVQWAKDGLSADEIVERVQELASRQRLYAVVDTLEYLYKGGRIGGAKMLMGSLLQVKPIIALHDSQIEGIEQQRTKRRALARLQEIVLADCPASPDSELVILHGDAYQEAKVLAMELGHALGLTDVPIRDLPPAILVHAGPGVLGVTYFVSKK